MSEQKQGNPVAPKKILESSPLSGISVPIAIVLVGALIIFGVTKMLSSGKNHRDLIDEMNSKTFGNRWVAAYELSKFLASSKIPKEDMPWVIENLSGVYKGTVDARTRNFVVIALGSLNNPLTLDTLNAALADQDSQVKFNAAVALGNMSKGAAIDWPKIETLFSQDTDSGLRQVALFTMASQGYAETQARAFSLLNSVEPTLRYAAAIVLIGFKKLEALPILQEILNLRYDVASQGALNGAQVEGLKINVLDNAGKYQWKELAPMIEKTELSDSNVKVTTKAKQVLKMLKN